MKELPLGFSGLRPHYPTGQDVQADVFGDKEEDDLFGQGFYTRPPPSFFPISLAKIQSPQHIATYTIIDLVEPRCKEFFLSIDDSFSCPRVHSFVPLPTLLTIVKMPSSSFFSFLPFIRSLHSIFVDSLVRGPLSSSSSSSLKLKKS